MHARNLGYLRQNQREKTRQSFWFQTEKEILRKDIKQASFSVTEAQKQFHYP